MIVFPMIFCGNHKWRENMKNKHEYSLSINSKLYGKKGFYEIDAKYACGGNGEIYLLKKIHNDNRDLVLKYFYCRNEQERQERWGRFVKEIDFLIENKNKYENIPEIIDYSYGISCNAEAWFIMPRYDKFFRDVSKSLKEKLEDFIQVFKIVKQFHDNNTIHRDIKISNLLRNRDQIIVADYGLLLYIDEYEQDRLTENGEFVGSRFYAPPELRRIKISDKLVNRLLEILNSKEKNCLIGIWLSFRKNEIDLYV